MSTSAADYETDPSFDLPYNEGIEELGFVEAVDILPKLEVYSDGVVTVNGEAYQLDSTCVTILSVIGRKTDGVSIDDIHEKLFGGYDGYHEQGASTAQRARFSESIDRLATLETEVGVELFTIYSDDDGMQEQTFVGGFDYTRRRKPFLEPEVEVDAALPEEQDKAPIIDLLTDTQKGIINVITDPLNYGDSFDVGDISLATVNNALFQTDSPNFDQNVALNQGVRDLNAWLARHGINLEVTRHVAPRGGVTIRVSDPSVVTDLKEAVASIEEVLISNAQSAAALVEPEQHTEQTALKPKTITPAVKKKLKEKPSNPFGGGHYFPTTITEKDRGFVDDIAGKLGLEPREVMAVRLILSEAFSNGKAPTGNEQKTLIAFLQRAWTDSDTQHRDVQVWADASFGVMITSYMKKIEYWTQHLVSDYDVEERIALLIQSAILGLQDGIIKFSDNGERQAIAYLNRRIHGAMVDGIRYESAIPRSRVGKLALITMDAAIDPSGEDDATLADKLTFHDASTERDFLEVEGNLSLDICQAVNKYRETLHNARAKNAARDLAVLLCVFGVTSSMTPEELEYYQDAQRRATEDDQTIRLTIAADLGLTESRMSQIVTLNLERLAKYVDEGLLSLVD